MTFIETFSGLPFLPLSPIPDDIRIQDIAHALSQQCRFAGHTRVFYSVAEHCVRVSQLLDFWGERRSVILQGLLHDASEAYLVDIPTPLKQSAEFAGYRTSEAHLQALIYDSFGLGVNEHLIVRKADAVLLSTEARDLMPFRPAHWGALTQPPLEARIVPWSSVEAERSFLLRFESFAGEV